MSLHVEHFLLLLRKLSIQALLWCVPHVGDVVAGALSSQLLVWFAEEQDKPSRRSEWQSLCLQVGHCPGDGPTLLFPVVCLIAELDFKPWVPRLKEKLEPVTVFLYTSHPLSACAHSVPILGCCSSCPRVLSFVFIKRGLALTETS